MARLEATGMTDNAADYIPEAEKEPSATPTEPLPEDIAQALGEAVIGAAVQGDTLDLAVRPETIADVCRALRDRESGRYDFLSSLCGIDYGDDLGVTYYLYQTGKPARVVIHVRLSRADPKLPSIAGLFPAADWNEREARELYGITFGGHPNPSNLLLPDDWEGYPLRKDYVYPTDHPYLRPDPQHELHAEEGG